MKSIKWMPAAALAFIATPALAATEAQVGKTIVWSALGIVFLVALSAILGSVLAANEAPNKAEDDQ